RGERLLYLIDQFIIQELAELGVENAQAADQTEQLRRLGLPKSGDRSLAFPGIGAVAARDADAELEILIAEIDRGERAFAALDGAEQFRNIGSEAREKNATLTFRLLQGLFDAVIESSGDPSQAAVSVVHLFLQVGMQRRWMHRGQQLHKLVARQE